MDTKEPKKSQNRLKKEQLVAQLVEKIDASNGLVFTDFQGLTHQQLENLKKELKKNDATIVIAKNSLMRLSLGQSKQFSDFKENEGLELPTATLFIRGDMIEPLKQLQKTIKEAGLPKIKFGVLDGQLIDESGVLKIASLPSRDTLIAQFVGMLNSPIQGLVVTLNGTIQKFVITLDAVAKSKPANTTSAPAAETTSSETPKLEEVAKTDSSDQTETSSEANVSNEETETASESAETTPEVPNDNVVPSSDGVTENSDEKPEEEKNETSTEVSETDKEEVKN